MPSTARLQSSGRVRSQRKYSILRSSITGCLRCKVARTLTPSASRRAIRLLPIRPDAPATRAFTPLSIRSCPDEKRVLAIDPGDFGHLALGERAEIAGRGVFPDMLVGEHSGDCGRDGREGKAEAQGELRRG